MNTDRNNLLAVTVDDVVDVHAIASALIEELERQCALHMVEDGNVPLDAVIVCLCHAMKTAEPKLGHDELLRRLNVYFETMDAEDAPGFAWRSNVK